MGAYFTLAQEGTITEGDPTHTLSLSFIPLENLPPEQPLPTPSPMPTPLSFDVEGMYTQDGIGVLSFDPADFAPTSGNLIKNGDFRTGWLHWYTQGSISVSLGGPTNSHFLKFHRTDMNASALVMQNTDNPDTAFQIDANQLVQLQFRLGNSSMVRRRITVIVHDADFSDQQVCVFWLEPNTPLVDNGPAREYYVSAHTNEVWTQPSVSFYDPNGAPFGESFQLDDVSMTAGNAASSQRVHCNEPQPYTVTPTPAPPTTNVELLQNGNFSQGYAPWVRSDTAASLVGGKLDFYKSGGAHVLYQNTPIDLPQYAGLQLVMEASNTSNVRRRMTVILNPVNWSDFRYCNFWLPANTTTRVFLMRTYTLTAWTDVNVSIYDSYGTSGTASIRIDNVRLRNGGIPTTSWTDCETNPPYCPAGFVEDVRSGCSVQQDALIEYGIELAGTWSEAERNEIRTAVTLTGQALALQGAGDGDPVQAFREVMQGWDITGESWRRIRFSRVGTSAGCSTTKKGTTTEDPYFSGGIGCGSSANMIQYLAIHELGHVFVGRTTPIGQQSAYRERIRVPSAGGSALLTIDGTFLMGPRTLSTGSGSISDWQRSHFLLDQGWGSAAQWNRTGTPSSYWDEYPASSPGGYPVQIPRIGPCDSNMPISFLPLLGTPFPYQQNPCTYSDQVAPGLDYEIEEAAADMFLNWVYWKISPGVTGFRDYRWRRSTMNSGVDCYPNGCHDPEEPGQRRGTWMDGVMLDMFTQFGW